MVINRLRLHSEVWVESDLDEMISESSDAITLP
jgi:hypothetical protein